MSASIQSRKKLFFILASLALFAALPSLVRAEQIPSQMGNTSQGAVSTANQTCQKWWSQCQASGNCNNPPTCSQTITGGTATGKCAQDQCNAQTYTDPQGQTQNIQSAAGFFQQALGLLQGLLGQQGAGGTGTGAPVSGAPVPTSAGQAPTSYDQTTQYPYDSNYGGTAGVDSTGGVQGLDSSAAFSAQAPGKTIIGGTKEPTPTGGGVSAPQKKTTDPIKEPSETFLQAVAGGFSKISSKISEVTLGVSTQSPPSSSPGQRPSTGAPGRSPQDKSEVRTNEDGSTIEIGSEDETSGISGFYGVGGKSAASASESLFGRLCASRPWADGVISSFIAPSFFDRLCATAGYHVGALPVNEEEQAVNATQVVAKAKELANREAMLRVMKKEKGISCTPGIIRQGSSAEIEWSCGMGERLMSTIGFRAGINDSKIFVRPQADTAYGISCSGGFQDSCTVRVIHPRVTIWSEPKAIRLGSRAIINWSTEDVIKDTCKIEGPSFYETGEFGRTTTVALSGLTSYTLTCTALDNQEVSQSVTVDLAL